SFWNAACTGSASLAELFAASAIIALMLMLIQLPAHGSTTIQLLVGDPTDPVEQPTAQGQSQLWVINEAHHTSAMSSNEAPMDVTPEQKKAWEESSDFANYFCTYAYIYHQKQMLTDNLRMQCYRDSIFENPSHFKDKVVLDVGTGSGILSIWAAQAGARKVYAVEATDIALQARKVVKANGQDHIVTVIQSKIEDVVLPEKVDVIISEWMGYFLLRESMFDSVLMARDRWLKPEGAMFPSHASMSIAPMCNEDDSNKRFNEFSSAMDGWRSFVTNTKEEWGVDMSVLGNAFRKEQEQYSLRTSAWCELSPSDLIGDEVEIASWDLRTCTLEDIKAVHSSFTLQISNTARFGGIAGWFDVDFKGCPSNPATKEITLTTSPYVQPTHWGQQVFPLYPPTQVCDGDIVEGTIAVVRRSDNQRLMNVKFDYTLKRQDEDPDAPVSILDTSSTEQRSVRAGPQYTMTPPMTPPRSFDKELHALYFLRNLRSLPEPYSSQDPHRVVLAFFCVHGLAILGELERVDKHQVIEWVYSLQVHPDAYDRSVNAADCGFRGGSSLGNPFNCSPAHYESSVYDTGNIASTYAALCILKTLGDDLSRVNKRAIVGALRHLQNKDSGCFSSVRFGSEEDMRFVFCACAISFILEDWSGIDAPAMVRFIQSCVSYDGSIGIAVNTEGQGGATYCAVAALVLSGRLMQLGYDTGELIRWLVFRQQGGFQGRCNKEPDSCYAFWNGATLDLLGKHSFVDVPSCREFILSCQHPFGGFCKYPDTVPDVMHSYYSLSWLSIAHANNQNVASDEDGDDSAKPFKDLAPLNTKLQVPHFPKPIK
ncbi:TPA: hypothetical protein N0F65_007362, partial [Lagenidium giganteum]